MTLIGNAPLVVWYNGFPFPTETETMSVDIKPVPDSAGRTVKYCVYTLTIRSVIAQINQLIGQTTDTSMESLRKILTAYGGEFHYEAVGLGNLTINVPAGGPGFGADGRARDVIWGPKPTLLKWKPMGQMACEILWVVEVAIPECDNASYQFALMEFCFKLNFDIDKSGYTKRTYQGFLRIPQTRATANSRFLTDQADAYRERIEPAIPVGFQRASRSYTLSEDKCKLDFSIVDEELPPNVPPPGVVTASCSHSVSTTQTAGYKWFSVLSGRYELARDAAPEVALAAFYNVIKERIETGTTINTLVDGKLQRVFAIRRAMSYSEPNIYGKREVAVSITHQLLCSLSDIIAATGLWTPLTLDNDWSAWNASLADSAAHVRGNAKMRLDNNVDAIIDLCQPRNAAPLPAPDTERDLRTEQPEDRVLRRVKPPEETSYIDWNSRIRTETPKQVNELRRLPSTPRGLSTQPQPELNDSLQSGNSFQVPPGLPEGSTSGRLERLVVPGSSPETVIQKRAEPSRYVTLAGYAIRAGYPVDVPQLQTVGDQIAVSVDEDGDGVERGILDVWFGVPIHFAKWSLRYALVGPVVDFQEPTHPYGSDPT
jgi:hypothetical protein